LAGYEWTVSQVRHDFLHYATQWDKGAFIFGLRLPERYKSDEKGSCQRAAEEVLSTLEITGPPLPHSMKGYELYSWYEKEDGDWYYTLITGTNRLKTLAEVRARTNIVQPDGWVSILVRETGPLKTLLRRLPPGEQVTWPGTEWLKQAGAGKDMVERMGLPESETVAEIEDLCRQLDLALTVTGRPSSTSEMEPAPRPTRTVVLEGEPQDGEAAPLILHETPIVDAEVMGPGRFEYNDQLGPAVLARIEGLRDASAKHALAQAKAALAPFGYRLESSFDAGRNRTLYDLYRKGEIEPMLSGLSSLGIAIRASVNASGTDFLLTMENGTNTGSMYLMVNSDGPHTWVPQLDPSLRPAYVGDALARITATGDLTVTYQVELDSRAVYTGTTAFTGAYMPVRSFTTWDDHWLLEVDDHLIMDGQDIGQALGYDAAFGFARLGDRSFYFFEQDGMVGISYGGQTLPNLYEQVFHNQCCEAAIHNVETGPDALWFHALREGVWLFVEAGVDGSDAK
jgi:hypothetical protein